jgi:hypothetical protein
MMRWAGDVACLARRNAYRILVGKRPLGKLDVGGRIILNWIIDRMGWYGLDLSGLG